MTKLMPEIRKKVLDELFGDWEDYKHHFNSINLKVATLDVEKLVNRTPINTSSRYECGFEIR